MLPKELAPEKQVRTQDFHDAQELLSSDYHLSYIDTSLESIDVREDGNVVVGKETMPFTPQFLESAAHFIDMPLDYAHKIDFDLFRYNFDQRKQRKCSGVRVCISREAAINLVKEGYEPARTIDVLTSLPKQFSSWKFHEAALSDQGVEFTWVDESAEIRPEPNDVILAGIRLSNSESGFRGLKASAFTLRLVCRNGATVADERQVVRWSYDKRTTYTRNIQNFCTELEAFQMPRRELAAGYASLIERQIPDREAVALWRRIRRVTGPDQADHALGVSQKERRDLFAELRQRPDTVSSQPTRLLAYEVHNRITSQAKDYGFLNRRRLEEIGGSMLRGGWAN